MTSTNRPHIWISVAGLLLYASVPATAANKLCAFRNGPSGPCTCKATGAMAGEFQKVSRHFCRLPKRAKPTPKKDLEAISPQQESESKNAGSINAGQAANANSTLVTGALGESPQKAPTPTEAPRVESSPAAPAELTAQAETSPAPAAEAPAQGSAQATATTSTNRLAAIRARGKVLCGVNSGLLGFSYQLQTGVWAGLDVDFCRAIAAAVFNDVSKVDFVPVDTSDRFNALRSNKIDVLARNTTWTMQRDVEEQIEFAGVLFFDGQGFLTSEASGLVSAQQLAGSKLCVEQATTSEPNMVYYFNSLKIEITSKSFSTQAAMLEAYKSGECDALTGDRSSLFADRAAMPDPKMHAILPEVISKEPLGPAVAKGDVAWSAIVRWTLAALINAEEVGLTKELASAQAPLTGDANRLVEGSGPEGEKLGLKHDWVRDVVAGVGNYGELFEQNVGLQSPLGMERGINALWKRGGLLYAPPMW